jgi:hypothetical protein
METMNKVNQLTNQLLDSPKMISDKLPWNNWNSSVEDSENSISGWIGKVFNIAALVVLLAILWGLFSQLWMDNGGFWKQEATLIIGGLLGILLWTYAAFPITQIIRNTSESISSSKSDIINLIFLDIPVAVIKLSGYVLAMVGLFAAISEVLSFITALNVSGVSNMEGVMFSMSGMNTLGINAVMEVMGNCCMGDISNIISQITSPDLTVYGGSAWTVSGAAGVCVSFLAVLVTLINLYITVAIYKFIFGLASTLVKWVKAPYLPFKSL